MLAPRYSPSIVMAEIACQPNRYSQTDLTQLYGITSSHMSKAVAISTDRDWVRFGKINNGILGRPRKMLEPTTKFWSEFNRINSRCYSGMTSSEQTLYEEAVEVGVTLYEQSHDPDSTDYLRTRASLLGRVAVLGERHNPDEHGWYNDSQAWLSLISIQAAQISGIPAESYSAHHS